MDPNFIDALNSKGNALQNLGDYNAAIECYNQAIKIDSNFLDAFYGKGSAL
jgi:tetratricopeptide (TPR) repeat protein